MPDSITAKDVAQLLTLVAPGFFAATAYAWVLPRRPAQELPMLLTSVALSLPLVAISRACAEWLDIRRDVDDLGYVALLLGISVVLGYAAGRLRDAPRFRSVLLRLGHRSDPDVSVLVRTVQRMPSRTAQVTVNFKGEKRVLAGTPRFATEDPEATDQELYLDHTRWWDTEEKEWGSKREDGGVYIRLDEVQSIELSENPE